MEKERWTLETRKLKENVHEPNVNMPQNKKFAWEISLPAKDLLLHSGRKFCDDKMRKWAELVHRNDANELVLVS